MEINVKTKAWYRCIDNLNCFIRKTVETTLILVGKTNAYTSIVLTTNKEIQLLNKQFRNKNKPTNVLSFPVDNHEYGFCSNFIGDIALGFETIFYESHLNSREIEHHTAHMLIHGILHLIGYNHEQDKEAKRMESKEDEALSLLGFRT